ncbi:hypothetical protein Q7C36_019355 [Tachysurus vachellii]|uniref:Polycomb group protein ASXL1 n=1 Tax=Tachysurus vachellii TaxID=175792 RepID=A0AA88LW64_TACVA|nr:hypothetical protein Q7C36_019355 [Tachysurus vachellii]
MKDKQKRKKERTWAEAARMVLENFSDAPMTPKQILHVIQTKGLKEMSGTAPLACLVTMLHSQVRGDRVKNSIFFKLPGRMSLFTLKKNALQWTKNPSGSEASDPNATPAASSTASFGAAEGAEQESGDSTETTAASGENDASVDETSSSASCSTEPQTRLSRSSQSGRQRKKSVMMPRVVLTPLKVNGEHVSSGPMKRNRGGVEVDFETPGSILVNTNIRALINTRTFAAFPPHSQQQLLQLLPEVDRQVGPDGLARLSSSALNNEFFTHASQSWKERLAEGEFTHEMQVRFRQEMEKEKKVEAWKEKFFEEYHGQKSGLTREEALKLTMSDAGEVSGTVLGADTATATPKRRGVGRRRREGRIRRRSRADLRRRARRPLCKTTPAAVAQEQAETQAPLEVVAPATSPVPETSTEQAEVVLQAESESETPVETLCTEAAPSPAPVSTPAPASTSSTCDEPEGSTSLLPEVIEPTVASTSSPSSSSSSTSSSSSPSSSPSSTSDQQGAFAASSDSSSSSSSTVAVATDPLDDGASITTGTAGTGASSRESSPAASPSTASPAIQLKEQKRRPDESQAFTSFPEKRARLDEHQSFRNTVDCVHSEKPQPTTEEPKVPPIRIQLSRIKPPWVKGPPTYQICPRIVPPSEGSRRSGTGARTLADIKARAQQARAQREAAAAVAATGDGAGPGGGGPGGGVGIPDCSSGRRSREHPGPVEPGGGGGGGGGGGRVDVEDQESSASSHSSGAQLQLSNVEKQVSTPQIMPSPSSVSSNPSVLPSESPKTLTPSPTETDSPASQDQADICGGEEVMVSSCDKASEQTSDTPVPTPSEPESVGSQQESRVEEADSNESRTVTPSYTITPVSTEAVNLVPTSIPDSLPRFGAQGVDVIRTLAASSQSWEGEQYLGEHRSGTTGVIQHGSDVKIPKETFVTARNGFVGGVEDHVVRERLLQEHKSVETETEGKYASSLSCLPNDMREEDGVHSDSTETASDFENETPEDDTVDWHRTMDHNGAQGQNTKSQTQPVIQTPNRLTSCTLSSPQHQQPVIQAHVSNPAHSQTVIQARFPNGMPNQAVIHTQKHRSVHTHGINHVQDQNATSLTQVHVQSYLMHVEKDQSKSHGPNDGSGGKSFIPTEDEAKPFCRLPTDDSGFKNCATLSAVKRIQGNARPVSSVEANNPLVTQLLQGSLPLEKVLPQSHSASKLEINRLPGAQAGLPSNCQPGGSPRNMTPRFRAPTETGGSTEPAGLDLQHRAPSTHQSPVPGRNYGPSPPATSQSRMACMLDEPSSRGTVVQQFVPQQSGSVVPAGAVPVITSLPSTFSSSRHSVDMNSQSAQNLESAVIKEHHIPQPSRGDTPDKQAAGLQVHTINLSQPICRTTPDAPSPPHGDLCPSEVVPTVKISWRPSKSQPLQPQSYQQQLSHGASVKHEVASRPSCQQALTKNSQASIGGNSSVVVPKKEPQSSTDNYTGSGGAMEGLLNMEMSFARMAKKEQGKNIYTRHTDSSVSPVSSSSATSASSFSYHLYGKLPKLQQSGGGGSLSGDTGGGSSGFSYTANVSVVDGSGFSRSIADSVLQLRPRVSVGNAGSQSTALSIQAFAESAAEEVALKCSCRLKAMIMCQGCGAFCHDDCIGPSKLCVSCLVVR